MKKLEATGRRGLALLLGLAFAPGVHAVWPDFVVRADAGMLASFDVRSNAFVEGTAQGSMSNYFWSIYWPYNWVRTTTRLGSNGLFRIDYTVYDRDRGSAPQKTSLSVLFFRPPGHDQDGNSPSNTIVVADLEEQLAWQRRKIAGVAPLSRRSEMALWTIEEALNGAQFFAANAARYQFSGTNGYFTFVSQLPESFPGVTKSGGVVPRRVRVFLEEAGRDKHSLMLEHTPLLLDGFAEPFRIILARHATWFWPWYYYDGTTRLWTNSWTATGVMPAQMRLSLAIFAWDGLFAEPYLSQIPDRVYSWPGSVVSPEWQIPAWTNGLPGPPTNRPPRLATTEADLLEASLPLATARQPRSRLWPLRAERHAVELEWLGRSGVELARYILATEQAGGGLQYDALNQKWAGGVGDSNSPLARIPMQNFPLGGGTISLRIKDLNRKFNLNLAADAPEILRNGLILTGLDYAEVTRIAEAIQDWQDADDIPRPDGAESDYYLGLNPPYAVKNGPVDDISELLWIKGVTPRMLWGSTNEDSRVVTPGLAELFTPVSGRFININTASSEVLQLMPDVGGNTAQAIMSFRNGPDGVAGNEDDMPFRFISEIQSVPGITPPIAQLFAHYFSTRSTTFEVTVDVKLGRQTRQYSAWLRRNGNQIVTFKQWRTK